VTEVMVTVDELRRSYGDVTALDGVSLSVEQGRVEALLGPNGAGKTTLVRILATLLRPDGGRATVAGHDVVRDPGSVRRMIAVSGQSPALDEDAPGISNLRRFGRLMGLRRAELRQRTDDMIETFELHDFVARPVRTFSGGQRRRVDLAVALLGSPRVLFLDEPTAGLDPRSRHSLWTALQQLVDGGLTVLLTTQYLEEADHLADHVTVIDGGRVVAADDPAALKASTGNSVLTLRFADDDSLRRAKELLGHAQPAAAEGAGKLTVPLPASGMDVPDLLATLYRAGVEPSEISVREPTLDDAFLMLTGHPTTPKPARQKAGSRA
jgi:daunorubicin resistance ABC transporter ATP-binding subunit